jgi:NAD(P)-dependent dehydrogenase (short-subunit alcohol dehydrogenase family)
MASPSFGLDGKVAWITGAGRGIGRSIAEGLAAAGAAVILQARTGQEVEDAVEAIGANGGDAVAVAGGVTDEAAIDEVLDVVDERFSGRLDILVNNAGISPHLRRTEQLSDEDWLSVVDVNLTGTFRCLRAAARKMLPAGSGSIVNVSSVHGSVGFTRLAPYSASKGGIDMLTRSLAVEWARKGIRVNSVAPGYVETSMIADMRASQKWNTDLLSKIPMGRFARPEEIVGAVQFLCSDAASYITGTVLSVDGGWTAQ